MLLSKLNRQLNRSLGLGAETCFELWFPGGVVWEVVLWEASRPSNQTITESGAWRL